jgi:AbrB family looped-hinge helix DNA binding protein
MCHANYLGNIHGMEVGVDGVGRVVIPKGVRERLGITGPGRLELTEVEGGVVLSPVSGTTRLVERDGLKVVERTVEGPRLDWEAVRQVLEGQRP